MNWLILRTEFRKEQFVARQVQALGFDAWVPVQIIACRPHIARRISAKAHLRAYREICILPRRVFAAMPLEAAAEAAHGKVGKIRHVVAVEMNAALEAISVPSGAIAAFRAEIDRENTAALALATRPSRRQRARWRSLHDALVEMVQTAREQLEQAA